MKSKECIAVVVVLCAYFYWLVINTGRLLTPMLASVANISCKNQIIDLYPRYIDHIDVLFNPMYLIILIYT